MEVFKSVKRSLAFFLPLLFYGCMDSPKDPIRIAMNPWPGYEFLYLAQEMNFFEEEGVQVKILEYSSLGDSRVAFERGQVDGMCCTLVELLVSKSRTNRDPRLVFVTDYSNGADMILGQHELTCMADLKGKRVAVEVGTLNMFLLARALSQAGLGLEDVEIHQFDQQGMETAFLNKEVDAVVTYPPVATTLLNQRGAKRLFTSRDTPGEVMDVICVNKQIIDTRFSDLTGMLRAWDRSLDYAEEHPEEASRIMARREGIQPIEFQSALTDIQVLSCAAQDFSSEGMGEIENVLESLIRILDETHQLTSPVSIGSIVDGSIVERMFAK